MACSAVWGGGSTVLALSGRWSSAVGPTAVRTLALSRFLSFDLRLSRGLPSPALTLSGVAVLKTENSGVFAAGLFNLRPSRGVPSPALALPGFAALKMKTIFLVFAGVGGGGEGAVAVVAEVMAEVVAEVVADVVVVEVVAEVAAEVVAEVAAEVAAEVVAEAVAEVVAVAMAEGGFNDVGLPSPGLACVAQRRPLQVSTPPRPPPPHSASTVSSARSTSCCRRVVRANRDAVLAHKPDRPLPEAALHAVAPAQSRFDSAVGAALVNSVTAQAVSAALARSVVAVGATVWHSVEGRDPTTVHCRSELAVGATVWCALVARTRWSAHSWSVVLGAAVWHSSAAHTRQSARSRSVVSVAAALTNSAPLCWSVVSVCARHSCADAVQSVALAQARSTTTVSARVSCSLWAR